MRLACLIAALALVACGDDDELQGAGGSAGAGGAELLCGPTEVPVAGSCVIVGVPPENCGEGFAADGRGGCEPILPADGCGPGELALPGESACHPLVSCTGTRWGRAPIEPNTEFVDAAFMGISDGSEAAPWRTIEEATNMAALGAVVAIAAGTYEESVWVYDPVRIWGSCPNEVTVVSPATDAGILVIGEGVELHDLAVTGDGDGIIVSALAGSVDSVWVHDTNQFVGVAVLDVNGPASLTMRNSLVESTRTLGVLVAGAELTVEGTVVRATRPNPAGLAGAGLGTIVSPESDLGSRLAMNRCIVSDVHGAGITLEGSSGTIDQSLVQDVLPQEVDGKDGEGIIAARNAPTAQAAQLTLTRSTIMRVHEAGVIAVASSATLSDVTVRDVAAQSVPPPNGIGIVGQEADGVRAALSIDRALIERSFTANIMLLGADGTIQHAILRDVAESDGVVVFSESQPAAATVTATRIENSPRAGASAFGGILSFDSTLFECNLFHLVVEPWNGLAGEAHDLGENHCGCGESAIECKALSQNLAPPEVGF